MEENVHFHSSADLKYALSFLFSWHMCSASTLGFVFYFVEIYYDSDRPFGKVWREWHRLQYTLVQMGYWTIAANIFTGMLPVNIWNKLI